MKAVKIYQAGGPEQLIYQDVSTPDIKEGWSLVKIKGFGINHSEIFTREGKSPSVQFPRLLGIECVGEVVQSSTPALAVGQKVVSIMGEMGRAFDGSYAEYVLLPNEQIYPIHTDLDWTTLAAIPETYYTAFGSLQQLRIAPQDRVLVRGAGSGVGVALHSCSKRSFRMLYCTVQRVILPKLPVCKRSDLTKWLLKPMANYKLTNATTKFWNWSGRQLCVILSPTSTNMASSAIQGNLVTYGT